MSTKSAPGGLPAGTTKRLRALESRILRLAATSRRKHAEGRARFELLESWILDLMLYLDIEVSELIEAIEEEEST